MRGPGIRGSRRSVRRRLAVALAIALCAASAAPALAASDPAADGWTTTFQADGLWVTVRTETSIPAGRGGPIQLLSIGVSPQGSGEYATVTIDPRVTLDGAPAPEPLSATPTTIVAGPQAGYAAFYAVEGELRADPVLTGIVPLAGVRVEERDVTKLAITPTDASGWTVSWASGSRDPTRMNLLVGATATDAASGRAAVARLYPCIDTAATEALPAGPGGVAAIAGTPGATLGFWTWTPCLDQPGLRARIPTGEPAPSESSIGGSIPTIFDLPVTAVRVAASVGAAVGVVLLIPFPSQLFDATWESNEEAIRRRLRRWLPWLGRRADAVDDEVRRGWAARARSLLVAVGYVLLGATLGASLDPDWFGGERMLEQLAGIALGISIIVAFSSIVAIALLTRAGAGWRFRIIPEALPIAIAGVLLSRLLEYRPGYLYGLLGGVVAVSLAARASRKEPIEVRATLVGTIAIIGLSVASWVGLSLVRGTPIGVPIVLDALGSIFVGGIQGVVFSMVPIRFLPGHVLWRHRRPAWLAITATSVALFVLVLLLGTEVSITGAAETLLSAAILLALFGGGSVAFWAYFRREAARRDPETAAAET